MKPAKEARIALVCSGGGARAAYEVGVLKALREMLPQPARSPFSIYCGVSGGAINAAGLALAADDFTHGVDTLESLWSGLRMADVLRADPWSVAVSGARWVLGLEPRALFDNSPLRQLLARHLDFLRLEKLVSSQALHALSITCSGYNSGQSVSFFQGRADIEPWRGTQRATAHVALGVEHVVASLAMPFLFPAEKLHREFFGDGAMRDLAPLSPAVHLGAKRILVIGTGRMGADEPVRTSTSRYPSPAEIVGHLLSAVYADCLAADVEHMNQINRIVACMPEEVRCYESLPWRPIDLMVIEPSERLDLLASSLIGELPWAIRLVLRRMGVRGDAGSAFLCYLMFEAAYTRKLIELGYRDAMARRSALQAFLGLDRV